MKIIKKVLKKHELTLKIENIDDLWVLSQIIDVDDIIKGRTERKIKIGDDADRNVKVVRKQFFIAIKVEKIELSEGATLRVLGTITDGPEEIPRGEHHSFNLENDSIITIQKTQWLKFQLKRIDESTKNQPTNILIVVFDREEAYFAKLIGSGYKLIAKMAGDVQKKEEKHVSKGSFYKEIIEKITEFQKTNQTDHIILASPGFWKEELLKVTPDEIKKKSVSATVSQANERAINEVLKRDELRKVLEQNRSIQEIKAVDKLLEYISKEQACYGIKETKEKIQLGAVEELLVSQKLLRSSKEKGAYKELENMMISCEQMDGKVHIISSEEAEKNLDSLTGIAGILRWKN